jgi:hypothetical protein
MEMQYAGKPIFRAIFLAAAGFCAARAVRTAFLWHRI